MLSSIPSVCGKIERGTAELKEDSEVVDGLAPKVASIEEMLKSLPAFSDGAH